MMVVTAFLDGWDGIVLWRRFSHAFVIAHALRQSGNCVCKTSFAKKNFLRADLTLRARRHLDSVSTVSMRHWCVFLHGHGTRRARMCRAVESARAAERKRECVACVLPSRAHPQPRAKRRRVGTLVVWLSVAFQRRIDTARRAGGEHATDTLRHES
jgi:hypothetical protein